MWICHFSCFICVLRHFLNKMVQSITLNKNNALNEKNMLMDLQDIKKRLTFAPELEKKIKHMTHKKKYIYSYNNQKIKISQLWSHLQLYI